MAENLQSTQVISKIFGVSTRRVEPVSYTHLTLPTIA